MEIAQINTPPSVGTSMFDKGNSIVIQTAGNRELSSNMNFESVHITSAKNKSSEYQYASCVKGGGLTLIASF